MKDRNENVSGFSDIIQQQKDTIIKLQETIIEKNKKIEQLTEASENQSKEIIKLRAEIDRMKYNYNVALKLKEIETTLTSEIKHTNIWSKKK